MRKADAIEFLGGTVASAASALGVTYQAVDKWPEELPDRIGDRVIAAWARRHVPQHLPAPLIKADVIEPTQELRHGA
ncbi:hypothetical protein DBR42_04615 [Pelomonas sp. HMWF004]|nr:hypothetical protein DBR42_04615 [Pelomonas sp. HMWF004]